MAQLQLGIIKESSGRCLKYKCSLGDRLRPAGRCARRAAPLQASYGGPERDTMRNLPVPANPPGPLPPPPPPPPPPPNQPSFLSKRTLLTAGLTALGIGLGSSVFRTVLGGGGRGLSDQELQELGYVGGQLGVPGMKPPVFLVASDDGQFAGLAARAKDGTEYLLKVDPRTPSRLLLKSTSDGGVYALDTRIKQLDLRDRPVMEVIFRTPDWEQQLKRVAR